MNHVLTTKSLSELSAVHTSPCLSLYQPTHRHHPDNQQDQIKFRNLVKVLEASLREQKPAKDSRALLEPFAGLAQDHQFWNDTLDGLAVLSAPGFFRVFRLQRSVPDLAVVADSFHTKPLRRFLQSVDRYQVLGLSRGKIQLFEGNRDTLDRIDPAEGVPRTMSEALGVELTDPHHTVASYGGVGGSKGPMHHGHGGKTDEVDLDAERFFRAIDRAVLEHHSKVSGLPLVLASLPEHHHLFRKVSRNPFLLEAGLTANPEGLPIEELRQRVWEVVEPQQRARQVAMVEAFSAAEADGLGSADLARVAEAAAGGRVATLLIEAGRQIAGRIDRTTGQIQAADLKHPQVDDLLDDLGELVETKGGQIQVLPAERMPTRTGLAAVYRH
ncbi:MAG TPA: hypothetical protein VML92_09065 [Steroidobacteraceae bacterium]|nr:hypothetical protein [Steroidobacteraceae bacterium]